MCLVNPLLSVVIMPRQQKHPPLTALRTRAKQQVRKGIG
jgi:hypothetical protein